MKIKLYPISEVAMMQCRKIINIKSNTPKHGELVFDHLICFF